MAEELKDVVESLGIAHIKRHIFLCCDQTKPKCSDKELSLKSWNYLKKRLKELKLIGAGGVGSRGAGRLGKPPSRILSREECHIRRRDR